jgi:hypothetical protein
MSVPTRRPWPAPMIGLGLALTLALAPAGCDQPGGGSTRPKVRTNPPEEVAEAPAPEPAPAPAPVAPRPIIGRTTQDVRDMEKEKQAGGVSKAPRITAKDPITLQGNAYVSIIGQSSMLKIKHDLDLYQATNGEYPKTLQEFMDNIIKPNGIKLPTLPAYQEYAYDAANHQLVIMEYPDRKEAMNYPK